MLDPKGLEAAWLAHDNACPGEHWRKKDRMEAAIRAYLEAATPADVEGLAERLESPAAVLYIEKAASALRSQAQRIGELERALEPLNKIAEVVFRIDDGRETNAGKPDSWAIWGFDSAELTYGDLRRARAALAKKGNGNV